MKILIVEDELLLRETVAAYLTEEGYICELANGYESALSKIHLYAYDCILLDLTLPGGDGLELLREIKKAKKNDGILILSARHSLDDKLAGLNLGADDYLVKPFHLPELKARITAIVRRRSFDGQNSITFHEIFVDTLAKEVKVGESMVSLTRKEYDLLVYFLANKGRVISRLAIAEHLWGEQVDSANQLDFIYTHIKNLRKKLVEANCRDYIRSMYGVGYKFSEP